MTSENFTELRGFETRDLGLFYAQMEALGWYVRKQRYIDPQYHLCPACAEEMRDV